MANAGATLVRRLSAPALAAVIGGIAVLLGSSPALAEPATSASEGDISHWWRFASRFHLVFLHIPIGFLALAVIIDAYTLFRPSRDVRRIVGMTLVLSFLGSLVVAALGLMLSTEGGYHEESLFWHQWLGLGVVALAFLCVIAHRRAYRGDSGWLSKSAYRGVLILTLAAVVLTGHHGGNLTHGSQYLVKYAPGFFKNIVNAAETSVDPATVAADSSDAYFLEKIQPIFAAKCERCHGPEKQKGDYRLDRKAIAFAGGESGSPGITAGDAFHSELVRLILLPEDDDDVMPPEGKEALTAEEIVELIRWVQKGAPFVERAPPGELDGGADALVESAGEAAGEARPSEEEAVAATTTVAADESPGTEIAFSRDIQPILERKCVRCHGAKKRKGKLRLHTLEDASQGGKDSGPGITPGKPEESSIYLHVSIPPDEDEDELLMPPADDGGPLTEQEIDKLRQWIAGGASWPQGLMLEERDDEE